MNDEEMNEKLQGTDPDFEFAYKNGKVEIFNRFRKEAGSDYCTFELLHPSMKARMVRFIKQAYEENGYTSGSGEIRWAPDDSGDYCIDCWTKEEEQPK